MARRLVLRHRIRVKLDCSFAPMVFWHKPSARAAAFFGVQGCVGGDVLAAVQPEGHLTGCPQCLAALGALNPEDALLATFRAQARKPRPANARLDAALQGTAYPSPAYPSWPAGPDTKVPTRPSRRQQ